MKKIKLPLEMANGVMVQKTIDELKENWDLTKVVEHFVSGKLVTWLNDRYYSDIAEKIENLPKDDGKKLQQELCKAFDMPCEDVELDVDEIAERKRRKDLLRQYTSDEKILDNVDYVAFDQEEMADLLDEGVAEIYLCNNKFTIPLNVEDKKYIGIGNVVAEIRSKKQVNFKERNIEFVNVKFDDEYAVFLPKIEEVEDVKEKYLQSSKVGDIIELGEWHSEPIEWLVLDVKDGKALLLSKYALTCMLYQQRENDRSTLSSEITWENCTLRKWLNSEFYEKAFSNECDCVVESKVPAHYNPRYSTNPGNDTKDRIFLLSVKETLQYLHHDEKICYPKAWVKSEGLFVSKENGACMWWMRSPGERCNSAAYGRCNGDIGGDESVSPISLLRALPNISFDKYGIRPACWVDLSKLE